MGDITDWIFCAVVKVAGSYTEGKGDKYIYSPIKLPQTSKAGKPKSKKLTARDRLGEFEYKWLNVQENERSEI